MNKIKLSLFLLILPLTSCGHASSTPYKNNNSISRVMTIDYGTTISHKATLLFGMANLFFDVSEYGYEKLYVGDKVKVSFDGDLLFQTTYPEKATLNGVITNIEVTPAERINFTTLPISEGGYKIIADNSSTEYDFPKYFLLDNNSFYSTDYLYSGLKFIGTKQVDKENNKIDGLYAIDFDETKVNIK